MSTVQKGVLICKRRKVISARETKQASSALMFLCVINLQAGKLLYDVYRAFKNLSFLFLLLLTGVLWYRY